MNSLSSTANADPLRAPDRLPPGPFSNRDKAWQGSAEEFEAALAERGIRMLPYPFDSSLAIASDVDGSSRETFSAYTQMLIHDLGLDFGDSTWLHWRYVFNPHGTIVAGNSIGFFSPSLAAETSHPPAVFRRMKIFREVLADYHEGNLDHFHALLPHGPRMLVLRETARDGGLIEAAIPATDATCSDFHIFGICFVFGGDGDPKLRSVRVESADAQSFAYELAEYDHPADGNRYYLFLRDVDPASSEAVPHVRTTARILAESDDEAGPQPERIILISTHGTLILDRLRYLRETYNVEMSLITEHSALHFRNPAATERLAARNTVRYQEESPALAAFNGRIVDATGSLIASTECDERHSFAKVLPEAVDDSELRFIVPIPASSTAGIHAVDLLARSPTQSGGGIYWAERTQPNIGTPDPGRQFDGKTRHDTFVARLEKAVHGATETPGRFWPIYTHLGGLARGPDGKRVDLPDPYFEPGPLLELQDRVFGITGNAPAGGRIWFTRASTLYDYALVLQGVARQVKRSGDGVIDLGSWFDPVLGKQLPRSPSQLYGLTFFTDDEARAEVRLDGIPIEHLIRNPSDESGQASVTIADCDIQSTLFRAVDPGAAADSSVENGQWEWVRGQDGSHSGRLTCESNEAPARLRVPMHGWVLPGAQLLSFRVRPDAGSQIGVLLETQSGGRFWFGSSALGESLGELAATYSLDRLLRAGELQRIVVPFHDLAWTGDAKPGGPLPSHPLKSVTLVCGGPSGTLAEFADMRLLRPRGTSRRLNADDGCCVIGVVPGAAQRETVSLHPSADPENARTTQTDQLGWFSFPQLPPGVYDVVASCSDGDRVSARGPTVEVWSDVPRLQLTRPAGESAS